ncbi:hypothetical protein CRG98_005300 [Punica granatum]|uniref:Uncharacterized protein n=1 Tax=Punica granatum TaxID=22663 RepID=A0A2I0L0S5_PUNGR|nr:hypothetical protein CRG98_005300 [Punica granatum]
MDLASVDVKIEGVDQALLLLCSLSESYESVVDTILYGRISITLEDVKGSLNSKELRKKWTGNRGSDGEGLIATNKSTKKRSRSRCKSSVGKGLATVATKKAISSGTIKGKKSMHRRIYGYVLGIGKKFILLGSLDALGYKYMGQCGVLKVSKGALMVMKAVLQDGLYVLQGKASITTAVERSTLEEKYLGDLGLDNVDWCKSLHLIGKSSKFLINRVIAFDKAALVEQEPMTGGKTCEEGGVHGGRPRDSTCGGGRCLDGKLWSVHKRKIKEARHVEEVQEWLGLEWRACKVRWSLGVNLVFKCMTLQGTMSIGNSLGNIFSITLGFYSAKFEKLRGWERLFSVRFRSVSGLGNTSDISIIIFDFSI